MTSRRIYTCFSAFVVISACLLAPQSFAAGSGGGGGLSGSTSSTPARKLSPEQLSEKTMRAGIRERDRALKHEAKAASAKSDKAREKSLKKAKKYYEKAIAKQGEAIRHDPQNYKAANELGFALRKTGDYRKAIGAYNYALELNPNFHQATEYRGEAFLALGFYDQTKQSYMILFRNDQSLASELMAKFEIWVAGRNGDLSAEEAEFAAWVAERKSLAKVTADLSLNNVRRWEAPSTD